MTNKIYIGSVHLEDYISFKGKYDFDLQDENGFIYQWTVILGNNNTGKTNFLKAIPNFQPVLAYDKYTPFPRFKGAKIFCTLFNDDIKNKDNPFTKKLIKHTDDNGIWGYANLDEITAISFYANKEYINSFQIYGFGVSRRFSETSLSHKKDENQNYETLFDTNKTLINIEEWLLQLDYATKNNDTIAERQLIKLKELIKSEIFPEIEDVRFISESAKNYVEFLTKEGWRKLSELGYGYQTTLSWIFDFSKKMFERYPNSENPLKEPAIVLIDELDLHLHPQWQRQIINFLTNIFSQTQFIVTTHSPFIIQSIEKINLFVLDRTDEGIMVHRPKFKTFKGWTIEEILDEVHGLGEKTKSDNYLALIKQFDIALDSNDYDTANSAYVQLCEILHPTSPERKLLKVQLSQIVPND